jgi:tetratricopeptide repeat protein/adenylate/guanylate cyclase family protein
VENPVAAADESAPGAACERIREHLAHGAPWDACDAFRAAVATHPHDPELLFCGALAHARAGATHEAHALLDRAQAGEQPSAYLLGEILGLRGRLWKDHLHRHPDAPDAAAFALRARSEYLAAYALQGDPYPGINAATLSMLLEDRVEAKRLAAEVAGRLAAQTSRRTRWDYATEGEAHLLLGHFDLARERYAAAVALAPGDTGSVSSMRRQVHLLARVIPNVDAVLEVLPATDVVAFAGHMIDAPGRDAPRFPAALTPAVQAALRAELARYHAPIVYTSAACGADLIFIEAALAIGAEVNVVLPFDRIDFVRTSVAVGGAGWAQRFDAALERATRVIFATEEGYLDDDVLFDYAAMLLEGLAALRAAQLEVSPTLLCVIDATTEGRVGGTHSSFDRWQRNVGAPRVIDLRALRERAGALAPPAAGVEAAVSAAPRLTTTATRPQRTLKTLLFADFAGFSRLHDAYAPLFQTRFLDIVAREIAAAPVKPLDSKTWGDGLYIVFESPEDGAEFALRLQASMLAVDWKAAGLSETSQIRIALHAGPVFRGYDPIVKRDGYFGSSVTRTARIEPVTPPGMVYASEAFAATLTASGQRACALEYVGRMALAKGYGESRIYRLERR